jgi:peptidoglycan LD-endopeptidase CwlK
MWSSLSRLFGGGLKAGRQQSSQNSQSASTTSLKKGPTTMTKSAAPALSEARTIKNLASLDADTRLMAEALVAELWNEHGLDFRVTSGTRTMDEQARLYAQGRTAPGNKVTNARPGYSWHNFGVAFDITLFRNGKPVWDGKEYDTAGAIGRRLGLEWGGAWTSFKDRPHFQKKTGMTLAEARAKAGIK